MKKKSSPLIFVVQEHHARHLHYDFRLEVAGVLKSWAIPKQPSLDPSLKRLAIMVEDHPYSYKDFEGTIPSGYGAGKVAIWDRGTYHVQGATPEDSEREIKRGLKEGKLEFCLEGKKLKGTFFLVRLKNREKNQWLLVKKKDKESSFSIEKNAPLTNLDKIFWPKDKITKGELIHYYEKIAPWILPHLKNRPTTLRRFPNGIEGSSFYQKNMETHPDWIETVNVPHNGKRVNYILIQNVESLLFVANLASIELHPFLSRISKLEYPDYLIFDLDPKGASFAKVVEVACILHEFLEEIGVSSYCKTSGATGLHVAVPLGAKYSYEQAKKFAELVALFVHQRIPKISTLERSISKRSGKVYIDCYQNNLGQTLAVVYGVRARLGASVSTPLQWKEVKKGLDPKDFTIKNIFRRLEKWGDLFSPTLGKGIHMESALYSLKKISKTEGK